MGLRYVNSESSSLITALNNNISSVEVGLDNLSKGAKQIVEAVDGKTLSGVAYTAASSLFQDCLYQQLHGLREL